MFLSENLKTGFQLWFPFRVIVNAFEEHGIAITQS